LWSPHSEEAYKYLEKASKLLASLSFIQNYSQKVNLRKSFEVEAIDVMAYSIAQFCVDQTAEEYQNFDLDTATEEQKDVFHRVYGVLTDFAYVPERVRKHYNEMIKKGRDSIAKETYDNYIKLVHKDRERYKRAQYKLLRGASQLLMEEFWVMSANNNARVHELVDISHPTVALACATLNHQRAKTGTYVNGRLALYNSSQWILHDTLAAAKRGDTIDAQSNKAINAQIKRIHKNGPLHTLGPLKPLLQGR